MEFLTGSIIGLIIGGILIWFIRQKQFNEMKNSNESMKEAFGNLSKEALIENQKAFFQVAEEKFKTLINTSDLKLEEKKKLIDTSLGTMNNKLESLSKTTLSLYGQIQNSEETIKNLSLTTAGLKEVLSNSQKRGKWGEKIVEDILNFIGLTEGINYNKQKSEDKKGRPDFTFYLPHNLKINMDVKFPFDHYENYLNADSEDVKNNEKKIFLSAVRQHVKTVEGRNYIDTNNGTVDYVLVFIPNEGVYSFINSEDKDIIDFALSRKIVLCSPITLYAVLSLIRQSVNNFTMEKKAAEIQKLVSLFKKQWEEFSQKMDAVGISISKAANSFSELKSTRSRKLEIPMDKIIDLELGEKQSEGELINN